MAVYTIRAVQKIPASIETVWALFSDPANLQKITPADMGFKIISKPHTGSIIPGQLIEYQVKPLWGISLHWITEITEIKEKDFFVDIQRKGPFRSWQHRHSFKLIEGGVEMADTVTYKNPLGFIGNLANRFLVKNKLRKLFEHRFQKTEELFGKWENQQPIIYFS